MGATPDISPIVRNTWDNNVIVTRDGNTDSTWDGKVKNLVYDTDLMEWVAMTPSSGGGGGGADVQYAEGTTSATPTGTVALGKTSTNALKALSVNTSGHLNINIASDGIADETVMIDEASSSVTYVGKATAGTSTSSASWSISKITLSGSVTAVQWADGDPAATNIWDDRASLSYS